jgi:hypothetical protein
MKENYDMHNICNPTPKTNYTHYLINRTHPLPRKEKTKGQSNLGDDQNTAPTRDNNSAPQ